MFGGWLDIRSLDIEGGPLRELYFYFPQAAWLLLLLVPLLFGQISLYLYRKKQKQAYAASPVLPRLLSPRSFRLTQMSDLGWLLIWTGACLALMAPFGNIHYAPSSSKTSSLQPSPQEILFLVDTSASMRVPDGYQGKNRLDQAKEIMEDIVRQLKGQLSALDTFTSELTAVVPSTLDYLFFRLAIRDLEIDIEGEGGTRFAPVLTTLGKQISSQSSSRQSILLVFSDGGDNDLDRLQGEAKERAREAILHALPDPQQAHFHLFSIGLGTLKAQPIPHVTFEGHAVSSALEPDILKQLAQKGRGKYYQAEEWTSWELAQELKRQIDQAFLASLENWKEEKQMAPVKPEEILADLYYQIPLGVALVFYLVNLFLLDDRRIFHGKTTNRWIK